MEIECATVSAAGLVVFVLLDAHLQPGIDFTIVNARELDLPITLLITHTLPDDTMRWLQSIPDATIACAYGT
ncbi:MAG TPA: hypothetical protein VKE41_00780 [Roseiflexaceae bacterium]|nr:hypothetical protein [Roseiflexaceae bacterium]